MIDRLARLARYGKADVCNAIFLQLITQFSHIREVQITYIKAGISVDELREVMRTICDLNMRPDSQFTMKWVDDEGDPCRIASQQELDEALRLYELEKDTEITIHGQYVIHDRCNGRSCSCLVYRSDLGDATMLRSRALIV